MPSFIINKHNWFYLYWNGLFVYWVTLFCAGIDYYKGMYHQCHVEAGMAILCGIVTLFYYWWCKRAFK